MHTDKLIKDLDYILQAVANEIEDKYPSMIVKYADMKHSPPFPDGLEIWYKTEHRGPVNPYFDVNSPLHSGIQYHLMKLFLQNDEIRLYSSYGFIQTPVMIDLYRSNFELLFRTIDMLIEEVEVQYKREKLW